MIRTTEDTYYEIQKRYWRSWSTNPEWGIWYPKSPNIKYTYNEESTAHVLNTMNARIKRALANDEALNSQTQYKIVKVRKIQITEDV